MKRAKVISLCCVLSLLPLVITGCWDRTEINDISIILGSAFDLTEDGRLICTYQIANPTGESGSSEIKGTSQQTVISTVVGGNVQQLLAKSQYQLSRKVFRAHRKIVLVGERMAERGIGDLLDSFSRDPNSRIQPYLLVVKGGEGREILKMNYPYERSSADAIRELIELESGPAITMRDLIAVSSSEGIEPVIGTIKAIPKEDQADKTLSEPEFRIAGAAIMKGLKLSGYLNNEETRGLQWIRGDIKQSDIEILLPENSGSVNITLNQMSRKIKPVIRGSDIKLCM